MIIMFKGEVHSFSTILYVKTSEEIMTNKKPRRSKAFFVLELRIF